ncbi:unnamed protein product [Symbiodinium microadriaticum]|nr:unnamed protein product [Symbiodinium microadriaticum]
MARSSRLPWTVATASLIQTTAEPLLHAGIFEAYPGYGGSLSVEGSVNISAVSSGIQVVSYALGGLDAECGSRNLSQVPNACGVHVHEGTSCSSAGGHFWNSSSMTADPWALGPVYNASVDGTAAGTEPITTGFSLGSLRDKVMVVHDSSGGRVACATFQTHHDGGCYSEEEWRRQAWLNFSGAFERCGPSAVCISGHERCQDACSADAQCEQFPLRLCSSDTSQCVHKPLFGHPVGADLGAACLFFLISGLALSAGIGGGGLYVPLLMIILGFQVHEATAISQPCLAGGAASALIYNVRQRHPSGLKPMIDYDLVLIMGPNLLVGAMVGSFLNFALPSWLILGMLVAILSHSVFKTFKKALETLRKERSGEVRGLKPNSDARLSQNPIERCLKFVGLSKRYAEFEDPAASLPPAVVGHRTEVDAGQIKLDLQDSLEKDPEGQIIAAKMTREPSLDTAQTQQSAQSQFSEPQYPRSKLIGFLLMWLVLVCSILFRGGHAAPGIVDVCSSMYWVIAAATAAQLVILSMSSSANAIRMEAERVHAGRPPQVEDAIPWTLRTAVYVSVWSLFAGMLAALCGIGGGMIMGPKLLDLGCLPQVQSATTATTLFVMSTSTTIAFLVQGTAPMDYSLFLGLATAMGAVVGKAVIGWVVKRTRRPSVIMFILGGIIATSVVVMSVTGFIDVVDDIIQGRDLGFRDPCVVA